MHRLLKGQSKQEIIHITGLWNLLPLKWMNILCLITSNYDGNDLNAYYLIQATVNAKDTKDQRIKYVLEDL